MKKLRVGIILVFLVTFCSQGQVFITTMPQAYEQNFDSLTQNTIAWSNNFPLKGWYIAQSVYDDSDPIEPGDISRTVNEISLWNGIETNTGKVYSFSSNGSTDRALGAINKSSDYTETYYGVRFLNTSSSTVTNITLSYRGEQWLCNNTDYQALFVLYREFGGDFSPYNGEWIPTENFDFVSPKVGFFAPLDGNAPGNSQIISSTLSVDAIVPGEEFCIRWYDASDNFGGNEQDHALSIDDVKINFEGRPATFGEMADFEVILKKPNVSRSLTYKSVHGFPVKGMIRTTNTVTSVSYATYVDETPLFEDTEPLEDPTNGAPKLTFLKAGQFKKYIKGKLFKNDIRFSFGSKGKTNRAGIDLPTGTNTLVFILRLDGVINNQKGSFLVTNILESTLVK